MEFWSLIVLNTHGNGTLSPVTGVIFAVLPSHGGSQLFVVTPVLVGFIAHSVVDHPGADTVWMVVLALVSV